MKCRELIEIIEKTYPTSAALSFDNVGLLVGSLEKDVKCVYLALDATAEVVEHAVACGADLLITHHPLIFSPLKCVTRENFIGSRIIKLIQHDISYYAMHTNYDVLGMACLAERTLELETADTLDVTLEVEGREEGIGKIGMLPEEMTLRECCEYVKRHLGLETVNVFGNLDILVRRMAISPGSGKSAIRPALQKGAQVLVTGDIGHHDGLDAWEQGLAVVDAGHYGTEYMFVEDMKQYLAEQAGEVEVMAEPVKFPCQVV